MQNHDTRAADAFHRATKYLASRNAAGEEEFVMGEPPNSGPALGEQDPAIEPLPYKRYTTLAPIELPHEFPAHAMPALDALSATGNEPAGQRLPTLADLARLCLLSNGLLKRGSHGTERVIEYRAAGGTGARYHLELYLVTGELPDLAAGVYHYAANDHTLRQLRAGDYRATLAGATGAQPASASAPVVLACTSTFWRNAWRYQGRAYRHTYWDAGTTFANLLAVAASAELPTEVVLGFADAEVNALLAVDGEREATVALLTIGRAGTRAAPTAPEVASVRHPFQPYSAREIDFPDIPAMHQASSLASGADAAAWRGALQPQHAAPTGELISLTPLAELPTDPIDAVIARRRSVRHYDVDAPLPFDAFSTIVERAWHGFAADCLDPVAGALHAQYLIVNNVQGLQPGVYVTHPHQHAIELLRAGELRAEAARLAVEQQYAADGQVNSYYLTDLTPVLERFGNRGYRVAQFEAALYAGKLHLAAHALGYGAVGSTSFDDEVIDFFSPHAAGKSYMFVLVFGKRRRRQA